MKDPMSGYASADTIASGTDLNRTEGGHTDELEDPMSGYASADAVAPLPGVKEKIERQ